MNAKLPELFSTEQASIRSGLPYQTLHKWSKRGMIPSGVRVGTLKVFTSDDIVAIIEVARERKVGAYREPKTS